MRASVLLDEGSVAAGNGRLPADEVALVMVECASVIVKMDFDDVGDRRIVAKSENGKTASDRQAGRVERV